MTFVIIANSAVEPQGPCDHSLHSMPSICRALLTVELVNEKVYLVECWIEMACGIQMYGVIVEVLVQLELCGEASANC